MSQIQGLRILAAVAAAFVWGVACGWAHAPFWLVVAGGLAAAAFGFWLERAALVDAETRRRPDFPLIAAAGYGFFAIIGIGLVSLSYLLGEWLNR